MSKQKKKTWHKPSDDTNITPETQHLEQTKRVPHGFFKDNPRGSK